MDCSRCGGELDTYSLGDNEAYVCTDCGFVDTPVEHEVTSRPEPEPWTAALKRFHEKFVEGEAAIVGSGETAALVEIDRDEPEDEAVDDEADNEQPADDNGDDADDEKTGTDDDNEDDADDEILEEDVEADDVTEEREKPA